MTIEISATSAKYKRGEHPNSRKNLCKPFPPGVNGNPHPGYSLTLQLKDALRKPFNPPPFDAPVRDHIVYATLKGAITCEPTSAHLKEVWDRVEGKVLGDQPPVTNQFNLAQINIVVRDEKVKELVGKIMSGERLLAAGSK